MTPLTHEAQSFVPETKSEQITLKQNERMPLSIDDQPVVDFSRVSENIETKTMDVKVCISLTKYCEICIMRRCSNKSSR